MVNGILLHIVCYIQLLGGIARERERGKKRERGREEGREGEDRNGGNGRSIV